MAEFELRFAALLEVGSERLIERLFGGMTPDEAMLVGRATVLHRGDAEVTLAEAASLLT